MTPIDEARRLLALRRLHILDTDREPAFDHITDLARQLFDVPIALISFVDCDRQWFKASAGLDIRETARDISFCAHAILEERIFIVNNASEDVRFEDNPLVLGPPNIRFYAGVPLHAPTGERIGTLCILDTRERQFTDAELGPLRALAGIIDNLLFRYDDELCAAYYDALTGLPNRLLMHEKLSQTLLPAGTAGAVVAVCAIQLDQFRDIVQAFGSTCGDDMVLTMAQRLEKYLGNTAIIGRSCADEFMVILTCREQIDALEPLCTELLQILGEPIAVGDFEFSTSASLGASIASKHGCSASDLITRAVTALTKAKKNGGHALWVYSADDRLEHAKRLTLYRDIKLALAHDEFELYFQTEVDIASGGISGIEALLRWNHPRLGLLMPADFIDAAEESGLIVPISEWVLRRVCRDAEAWMMQGLLPCAVAVNISARHLLHKNFEETIRSALHDAQLPAAYLELEFDEPVLTSDHEQVHARLLSLRNLGVRLTVSDFGSGHLNPSQLTRLTFDKLKIDQSYIRNIRKSTQHTALVRTLLDFAHNLQLQTVANGVESVAQLGQLRAMGCNGAQGFLFSKPMCTAAMHALLHNQTLSAGSINS